MSRVNYRHLLDQGRKAGLTTSELYSALSTHPPEAGEFARGQTDGNGFLATMDSHGQASYHPNHDCRPPLNGG